MKIGARRFGAAVYVVQPPDEVPPLNLKTERRVVVRLDSVRPRRARQGARMLRRRLPSVSLPLPAEVWESRVQPLEKRGIHLLFKKLSQIHLSVLISFHPFLKITRDDKLTLNIPLPVDHERFHVRVSGEVEDFLKADDAPGPLFHNFDRRQGWAPDSAGDQLPGNGASARRPASKSPLMASGTRP